MQLPRATRLFIRIRGELHYLWRAVDQDGIVLDVLVQVPGMPERRRASSSGC
ncbi:DDE-type integrase/transposase/recombinase [Acidisoma sp. L85]|uniref:DDE-type integrase/transposase/recombinase n=1 Tax=Acidisoma sp. L85 TaxID=1641850 RepID=UPI00352A5D39